MSDFSLDKEKFDGIQLLGEITQSIARGRATLATMRDEEDMFLNERADKLKERIEIVLTESEEHIKAIAGNREDLTAYRNEIEAWADELTAFFEKVVAFNAASETSFDEGMARLDAALAVVRQESEKVRKDKEALDAIRAQDDVLRASLRDRMRRVSDDEQRLERAFARLEATNKK